MTIGILVKQKMVSKKIRQRFASGHNEHKQWNELCSLQIRHKKISKLFSEQLTNSPPAQLETKLIIVQRKEAQQLSAKWNEAI